MNFFSVEAPPSLNPSQGDLPPLGPGLIHPVSTRYGPDLLLGELKDEDTAWLAQSSGFVTETQTFYITLPGGKLLMCQVIHSSFGLWYPQIQLTFRYVDHASDFKYWKSSYVSGFKTPPLSSSSSPKYDRRSCKGDQFSFLLDPNQPDRYQVTGKHDDSVQFQFTVTRMPGAPGWKLGQDCRGGLTYFGRSSGKSVNNQSGPDYSASSDGYVVHRFWPRCSVSGHFTIDGRRYELDGSRAIFIHAIQGMRPNLIATHWNFCNFQSVPSEENQNDPGVSLILMEFITVPGSYGPSQTITIGSVVVGDKLVGISCSPSPNDSILAKTVHQEPFLHDQDTGYEAPSSIKYRWISPLLPTAITSTESSDNPRGSKQVTAEILLDLDAKRISDTETYATKGLVEKVDVMNEIPYLVKKVVAAVAGARPYIYTWLNPISATITLPKIICPPDQPNAESSAGETTELTVNGHLFNEATFISDL